MARSNPPVDLGWQHLHTLEYLKTTEGRASVLEIRRRKAVVSLNGTPTRMTLDRDAAYDLADALDEFIDEMEKAGKW